MYNFLLLVGTLCYAMYYFVRRRYTYWKRLGIESIEPEFPYGNIKTLNSVEHSSQFYTRLYKHFKGSGRFAGIYMFLSPVVIALDMDFVKTILVKDFQFFVNRGNYFNEKDDPISAHLFNLEGQKWRNLRTKLSPTFTSGKMKFMYPTIVAVAKEFQKCVHREMENNVEVEMKDVLARFTTDVIGTCAFGLECNSLNDPFTEFRIQGRRTFEDTKYPGLWGILLQTFPNIARAFHVCAIHKEVTDFFQTIVRSTIEYREKSGSQRNDFMNLLMQLKNKGKLDGDDDAGKPVEITVDEIAAQAFIFFLAGFETSSTAMGYALHEISLNQEIQDRARQEVKDVLEKYDGELSYEAALEMKYIDQIINESLRKYSPVPIITRNVSKDYLDKSTGIVFKKDMKVIIPAHAIHHDPEFYPNPDVFDPDRFTDEMVKKRNPYTFLPFGEGPRVCIGLRFGMMQARIGMAVLLQNFKFTIGTKTQLPMNFIPKNFILTTEGGLYLNIQRVDA